MKELSGGFVEGLSGLHRVVLRLLEVTARQ